MNEECISGLSLRRSETQARVREIWIDVLELREFDSLSTFLDLGGDSLAAMRCISRIRTAFDVELTVGDFLLDSATVAVLAELIDESASRQFSSSPRTNIDS